MSALRTRMIEDMQLAGLSATTQEVYLQAVTALVLARLRGLELFFVFGPVQINGLS